MNIILSNLNVFEGNKVIIKSIINSHPVVKINPYIFKKTPKERSTLAILKKEVVNNPLSKKFYSFNSINL